MLHVVENLNRPLADFSSAVAAGVGRNDFTVSPTADISNGLDDIDLVDDSLLNTAPHNAIERQLLNGDVVGLALMSGAILWSAMGAFG